MRTLREASFESSSVTFDFGNNSDLHHSIRSGVGRPSLFAPRGVTVGRRDGDMTATFVPLSIARNALSPSLGPYLYDFRKKLDFWTPSLFTLPIPQPISTIYRDILGYPLTPPCADIIYAGLFSPSAASTSNTEWCALLIYAL